ncbi:MAG: hypothetical protein DWG81_04660 [Chloroflexi bacterium]|nr:hypothetical protein [Chloroflexota bacterium]
MLWQVGGNTARGLRRPACAPRAKITELACALHGHHSGVAVVAAGSVLAWMCSGFTGPRARNQLCSVIGWRGSLRANHNRCWVGPQTFIGYEPVTQLHWPQLMLKTNGLALQARLALN